METIRSITIPSPVGALLLEGDESGLTSLRFVDGDRRLTPSGMLAGLGPLEEAAAQLAAYFAGERRDFEIAIHPTGTPFQLRVWSEVRRIPYGTNISYAELALRIDHPRAVRAVGAANGANPIPIIVPCHRVIGSSGELTGYAGGLGIKRRLIALEREALQTPSWRPTSPPTPEALVRPQ